jgi:competence protein ComEA
VKLLLTPVTITKLLVAIILCGVVAIVWVVAAGNGPSAGSVRIESANATSGKAGTTDHPALAVGTAISDATPATLDLGSGKLVDPGQGESGAGAILSRSTPRSDQDHSTPTPVLIYVYVTGAVAKPGVYTLPEGSRVQDAIAAAGGAMIQADLDGINLAERLTDEAHVIISRRDDSTPSTVQQPSSAVAKSSTAPLAGQSGPTTSKAPPASPVNINTASAEQLQTLPGIGPSTAARIIADREQNGPFRTIEDLTRITGIKEGTMAKIRAYITVGN